MTHEELCQKLYEAGFEAGWVLFGETLTVWEHEEEPPAPFVRPTAGN